MKRIFQNARLGLTTILLLSGSSVAWSIDLEKANVIETILVARYLKTGYGQATPEHRILTPTQQNRDNPEYRVSEDIASDALDMRANGLTLYGVAATYAKEEITLLFTKATGIKSVVVEDSRSDDEVISQQYVNGNVLVSCSSLGGLPSFRVFAFAPKKPDEERAFLMSEPEPANTGGQRMSFWEELRKFKVQKTQYLKEGHGYKEIQLPADARLGLTGLRYCNNRWYAFFSSARKFEGSNKLFFVEDLLDMTKQEVEYNRQGFYLIDVAKGFKNGILSPTLWVGVFSDNPQAKEYVRFEYARKYDIPFAKARARLEDAGYSLESITAGSRGVLRSQLMEVIRDEIKKDMIEFK